MHQLWFRSVKGSLTLVIVVVMSGASPSLAQSPVQEVGDEKEPALRAELVRRVKDEQGIRAEFDRFRRDRGLFTLDNKAVNQKLDADPELKKDFLAIAFRMMDSDKVNTLRMKQIVAKYGWPGRTLVGTEAAGAAWLLVQHSDWDVAFQRQCLELIKKLPSCEVENTHLASLTDRVLLNEGKKQLYGMMLRREDGKLVPKPIEDEANVDKRRAELGLQPLAEYLRRVAPTLAGTAVPADRADFGPSVGKASAANIALIQTGMTDGEVIALLGPADSLWTSSADNGFGMTSGLANYIRIIFKDDRAVDISGRFSERGLGGPAILENLRRLRRGMSRGEVEEVLGKTTLVQLAEGINVGLWAGASGGVGVTVQFADGKVTGVAATPRRQ